MVRQFAVALLLMSLPAAAWSKPPKPTDKADRERGFHMPQLADLQRFEADGPQLKAEISPNSSFGIGIFGLKPDKTHLRPVTVREITVPRQRRAAVGFSLKF